MAIAKFVTGNTIVRSRVFTVVQNPDQTYKAVFKNKKYIFFTKKVQKRFLPSEAMEKLVPKKPPTYEAWFDNKSGEQLTKAEVLKGEIDQDRLKKIRDAQGVLIAEKNIDKSNSDDKIMDRFMIGIAIFIILIILFVVGVYYQGYDISNLASVLSHPQIVVQGAAVQNMTHIP